MKIHRTIKTVHCPTCDTVLLWDSFGCDNGGKHSIIDAWCSVCKKHHEIWIGETASPRSQAHA